MAARIHAEQGPQEERAEVRESEAVLAATLSARAAAEAAQAQRAAEYTAAEAERAQREADEARKAAEERLLRGIPPDMRPTPEQMQEFRARHGYAKHALNIAFTGESGVGKSALLNALRGMWPEEEGAAAVGVNKTTAVVEGYTDARHPHIKWYDVPGANTPTISGWMYFMDQSLYIFDVLVIVFSDRFSQTAGTLLHNAQRCGIPAFLVRTKADYLVRRIKRDRRNQRLDDARARAILRAETQDMVNDNLAKLNLPTQRVYLVSEDGMRDWVVDRDSSSTIDEPAIFEILVTAQPGKDPNQG
ncbi:interferon-inducible GTPase-domain-containing protein [Crassisporium funariophilum]|nr:interferon-inducible GTPase-domain-containing protein [Crassisporium funariophilum]